MGRNKDRLKKKKVARRLGIDEEPPPLPNENWKQGKLTKPKISASGALSRGAGKKL